MIFANTFFNRRIGIRRESTVHHFPFQYSHWPEGLVFLFVLLLVAIAAFEVWMFFDCVLDRKMPSKNKVWWIIGMLLIHPFVAIFYYFLVYRPHGRQARKA